MVGSGEKIPRGDGRRGEESAACDVCREGSAAGVGRSVVGGRAGRGQPSCGAGRKTHRFQEEKTHHFHSALRIGGRGGDERQQMLPSFVESWFGLGGTLKIARCHPRADCPPTWGSYGTAPRRPLGAAFILTSDPHLLSSVQNHPSFSFMSFPNANVLISVARGRRAVLPSQPGAGSQEGRGGLEQGCSDHVGFKALLPHLRVLLGFFDVVFSLRGLGCWTGPTRSSCGLCPHQWDVGAVSPAVAALGLSCGLPPITASCSMRASCCADTDVSVRRRKR